MTRRKGVAVSQRTIFRQSAILAYRQSHDKDVVLRLISWPIVACLWTLLGFFVVAGFLTWYVKVPVYLSGAGVIPILGDVPQADTGEPTAIVFLHPEQAAQVRVGQPADVQIGSMDEQVRGTIAAIEPGIMSPAAIRSRYRLDDAGASLVTQPAAVAMVRLDSALPTPTYAGSLVTARLAVGSQRLLALLPGLGEYLGRSG